MELGAYCDVLLSKMMAFSEDGIIENAEDCEVILRAFLRENFPGQTTLNTPLQTRLAFAQGMVIDDLSYLLDVDAIALGKLLLRPSEQGGRLNTPTEGPHGAAPRSGNRGEERREDEGDVSPLSCDDDRGGKSSDAASLLGSGAILSRISTSCEKGGGSTKPFSPESGGGLFEHESLKQKRARSVLEDGYDRVRLGNLLVQRMNELVHWAREFQQLIEEDAAEDSTDATCVDAVEESKSDVTMCASSVHSVERRSTGGLTDRLGECRTTSTPSRGRSSSTSNPVGASVSRQKAKAVLAKLVRNPLLCDLLEEAVWDEFGIDSETQPYLHRVRCLVANLRRNEQLNRDFERGAIPVIWLATRDMRLLADALAKRKQLQTRLETLHEVEVDQVTAEFIKKTKAAM